MPESINCLVGWKILKMQAAGYLIEVVWKLMECVGLNCHKTCFLGRIFGCSEGMIEH